MASICKIIVLGSLLQSTYGVVLPIRNLDKRSFSCPSQVSTKTNVTLPDPDPSVNATIQGLVTANLTFYNPIGSTNLTGLTTNDTTIDDVSYKLKARRSSENEISDLFIKLTERASSGGGGGGGSRGSSSSSSSSSSSRGSSSGSSSGGSSSSGSTSKPASGSSTTTTTTKTPTTANTAPKPAPAVKPPTSANPMAGTVPKTATVVNNKSIYKSGVQPVNNVRPYYNSMPASSYRSSTSYPGNTGYLSSQYGRSYYSSRYAGQSSFGWYSYPYLGIWLWYYPAWAVFDADAANPGVDNNVKAPAYANNGSIVISQNSTMLNASVGFTDPDYRDIAAENGVITLDASGTLYKVAESDINNTQLIEWAGDHLLETSQLSLFFSNSSLPAGVDWSSVWSQMQSCTPWPAAVTAILNTPTNLIGLDIVLNHLKTLVLVENGSSDWPDRPAFFYTGLFNYMTMIRPNYLATAQAIDTLIGQISGSSNVTNNVFAEWAAERFDNATTLVALHAP